jgi:hypothetical protein
MRLAEVTGERMKPFLRDSFATILEGAKIPHKVTSGYIDECIVHLIKHVTFKGAIVLIMHEIKESKSKAMRERCLVSYTSRDYAHFLTFPLDHLGDHDLSHLHRNT